jgi:hypothetical protein
VRSSQDLSQSMVCLNGFLVTRNQLWSHGMGVVLTLGILEWLQDSVTAFTLKEQLRGANVKIRHVLAIQKDEMIKE